MAGLAEILDSMTKEGELYEPLPKNAVRCYACGHRCVIPEGKRGVCKVRFNRGGKLYVPWGYVAALQADPIEKKPFYHILPGANALTFGMLGCDFHCAYCQNWLTSQALRDPASEIAGRFLRRVTPKEMIHLAKRTNSRIIASSYNEPLITSEWAAAIFREAKQAGLKCVYVSNGNATPETLQYLRPWLDAYKVDLKSMRQENYRQLGGNVKTVLRTIESAREMGLWVEVVTLVVPGFNDSVEELWETARFLAGVSADIPWHVTAFHKDYRMTEPENTSAQTLLRAADIGREAGLRYVYAGNIPGRVGEYEDTRCPHCGEPLIRRAGYTLREYRITAEGACPRCGEKIAGLWWESPEDAPLGGWGMPIPLY